jgi:hypothetical protein
VRRAPARELEAITDEPGQGWAARMAELLVDGKLVAERARAAAADRVDDQARASLHARSQRLLADGRAANPPPPVTSRRRGRTRRSPAANLLARLDRHRDQVLGRWTTRACRSTTTGPYAICGWSSCSRRSRAAGAPWPAPSVPGLAQLRLDRT